MPDENTAVAISTYQTYWMVKTSSSGSYAKVIDIKDYGDLIATPNMLDATTLSHGREIQIAGIARGGDGIPLTANYTLENYAAVKQLEGHQYDYAIYFGGTAAGEPDGHDGVLYWTGDVVAGIPGKGVDEVMDMTITCMPSTDVLWASGPSGVTGS